MMTSRNDRFFNGGFSGLLIAAAVLIAATSRAATSVGYIRNGLVAHWDGVENADFGGTVCGLHVDGEPVKYVLEWKTQDSRLIIYVR